MTGPDQLVIKGVGKDFKEERRKVIRTQRIQDAKKNVDDNSISIIIGVPYFGTPHPKFWISLFRAFFNEIRVNDNAPGGVAPKLLKQVEEQGVTMNFIPREGHPIDAQRNLLFRDFLEVASKNPDSRLVMIDSDALLAAPDTISLLFECDVDMVTTMIFNGSPPHKMCMTRLGPDGKHHPIDFDPKMGAQLIELDSCGCHCVMIKRKVIEAMERPYFTLKLDENREFFEEGEDISFFPRAKAKGFKLYCRPDLQVPHMKNAVFGYRDYHAYREIAKQEQAASKGRPQKPAKDPGQEN